MEKNIQTFIFIHDQNIVLDFIKVNKFSNLPNLKFVFVGNKPTDKIINLDNVIICRNLKHNIEDYPNLTSFTGWYALWKNNLISSNYINLFEYDINISDDLQNKISFSFDVGNDVVGFIPLEVSNYNYMTYIPWISNLMLSMSKIYNLDLIKFINSFPSNKLISMTSNHSMKNEVFENYMEWISPMIDQIKTSFYSGHEMERSISVFYLIKNLKYVILNGEMQHFQFDSHQTQGIGVEKFINNYKNLL